MSYSCYMLIRYYDNKISMDDWTVTSIEKVTYTLDA